ncbi:hypothetical protein RclHR1_30650001 [Rhizophagus clarus]|uniref:Uncharacterized protein n=1 Tax=Rhizophagus clarus TaxID=94130 RepID=A0A2Z6R6S6_9GLOM|nr:hypothetical protein RclHR1_30650001 [Rhizophagus clarus]
MTSEFIVNENTDFDAIFEQVHRVTIMNDFFDTFTTLLDNQSYLGHFVPVPVKEQFNKIADKQKYSKNLLYILYRTTFLIHEDALHKDGDKILKNILDDSYDLNHLSNEFMDIKISINKEHQSQSSAASTSTNQNEDGTSQKQDKQKAKVVEQVSPDIPTSDPEPVVIPQPQVVLQSASSFSLKLTAKLFIFRTKSEKNKDNFKAKGDDAAQIITGYHPNPSLEQYCMGNVISMTVKKQKKYKTVRCKERFQAVVEGPPGSFTADAFAVKEHLTNFINPLYIKAFKEVKNLDGMRKMITYFESCEDLQNIISKESFWNGIKLSWCRYTVPSFITCRKSSQRSSSDRQDKSNKSNQDPPSKRIKVSSKSKSGSPATGFNRVPIRSPLKDSSQSSSSDKTGRKNKKSQKTKDKSTGTSSSKKLSKRQLHTEIVELKTVLIDFIRKQFQD